MAMIRRRNLISHTYAPALLELELEGLLLGAQLDDLLLPWRIDLQLRHLIS
jgi:hypothetical protein